MEIEVGPGTPLTKNLHAGSLKGVPRQTNEVPTGVTLKER